MCNLSGLLGFVKSWTGIPNGIIIVVFVGAVAALLGHSLYGFITEEPDFDISMIKPLETISATHDVIRDVTITNIHGCHPYNFDISLIALERNSNQMPNGTHAKFSKPLVNLFGIKSIKSRMTITVPDNAETRDYLLDIVAVGENGKEKRCSLVLNKLPEDMSNDDRK